MTLRVQTLARTSLVRRYEGISNTSVVTGIGIGGQNAGKWKAHGAVFEDLETVDVLAEDGGVVVGICHRYLEQLVRTEARRAVVLAHHVQLETDGIVFFILRRRRASAVLSTAHSLPVDRRRSDDVVLSIEHSPQPEVFDSSARPSVVGSVSRGRVLVVEGFSTGQTAVEATVAAGIGIAADYVADERTRFGILRDVSRVRVCLEEGVDDDGRSVVVDVIDGELEGLERVWEI